MTICIIPGHDGTRLYGISAGAHYLRKKTMGAIIRRNQAGSLRVHGMRERDDNDFDVRSCFPVGGDVYGADFSFSLVF